MGIQGLDIGLSALRASQTAMETIGHNLSNANTPGYSRQSVLLGAAQARVSGDLRIGTGVETESVTRTADGILNRRIVTQTAQVARLSSMSGGMSSVEALLGEPGGFGIGGLVDGFFESIASLSASPDDSVFRAQVARSAQSLTAGFHQLSGGLDRNRADALGRVELLVDEVNGLTAELRDLNLEIGQLEGQGIAAGDLRDQRDEALRALAQRVDVTYYQEGSAFRVFTGGQLLVGPSTATRLEAVPVGEDDLSIRLAGGEGELQVTGGEIGGLLEFANEFVPALRSEIDTLANSMIFEMNRIHSGGVPPSGGFTQLTGSFALSGPNGGDVGSLLLADAGLPFDIQEGRLYVTVVNQTTGAAEQTVVEIDPAVTSVDSFIAELESIARLHASVDSQGRVNVRADGGFAFHFGGQFSEHPDVSGSFGGGRASLGTGGGAPFALANGDTLDLTGPAGAFTVTFDAADFADIGSATAEEVAAVLNASAGFQAGSMRAEVVGGQVFVQSQGTGVSESFDVDGGSALAALGLAPTTVTGSAAAVDVRVGGTYTGPGNDAFTFRPTVDGTIGTTEGLQIEVTDAAGFVVATLEVGANYQPGTELDLPGGLTVSFTFGEISASNNDAFVTDLVGDSDTSDVLAALGINSMFTGSDAMSFEMRSDLTRDPSLIAASRTGAAGDGGTLLGLLDLQQDAVAGLDASFSEYYGNAVGRVGFEISSTENAAGVEQFLADSLTARREQISGVNVDEELVNLIQYEQAFTAASRFIQTVNNITDELMNLL